jgi:hypothetical protein
MVQSYVSPRRSLSEKSELLLTALHAQTFKVDLLTPPVVDASARWAHLFAV